MRILAVLFALIAFPLVALVLPTPASADDPFEEAIRDYLCRKEPISCMSFVSGPRIQPAPIPEKRSADFPETPYNYPTSWPSAPPSLDRLAWDAYWATHSNAPIQPTITSSIRPPAAGDGGLR